MNGKGSKRRKPLIPREQVEKNFDAIDWGKPKPKKRKQPPRKKT